MARSTPAPKAAPYSDVMEDREMTIQARNLDELAEEINGMSDEERRELDMSDLPLFGGTALARTEGVWSWDETRLLVGNGSPLIITPRAEWPGRDTEANARLIAAAPALAEALAELVAEFDADSERAAAEPGVIGLAETGGVILARAALQKAGVL